MENVIARVEMLTGNLSDPCFKVYQSHTEMKMDEVDGELNIHEVDGMDMTVIEYYNSDDTMVDIVGLPYYENLTPEQKEEFDAGETQEAILEEE